MKLRPSDVLYLMEKETYEAAVEKAKADLAIAMAGSTTTPMPATARPCRWPKKGVVTREELDQRKAERSVAQANIYAGEATLKEQQIQLDYCEVTTPISGRVGKTLIDKGNLVDGNTART